MTQDKIRAAFETWLGAPNDSWKNDPLSVGSIQEEAWQACAAEMGKDMDAIGDKVKWIDEYINTYCILIHPKKTMSAITPEEQIRAKLAEALALADKWRG
jgi:hypothetical protein